VMLAVTYTLLDAWMDDDMANESPAPTEPTPEN
jgi:hypothetical protein